MSVPSAATSSSNDELEWVELRKELDKLSAEDRAVKPYKNNWIIKGGVVFTACAFLYGCLNMKHPMKSTYGAYCRIAGQAVVGMTFCYGFLKYNNNKKNQKINMNYHD